MDAVDESHNSRNEPEVGRNDSRNNLRRGLRYFVEPATFMMFFVLNLSGTVFQNQVLYQVCHTVFGYDEFECSKVGTNATNRTKEIETEIQPYVANILMTRGIIEGVIPAVASLFIGPWSDKYGRKPVMLACFIGVFGMYILLCLTMYLSSIYTVSPWYYVAAIVPVCMTGSTCSLITCLYCYLADITTEQNRAFRMAVNEGVVFLGLMLGSLCSTYLYLATNALTVHAVSGGIILLAILYITFVLKESLHGYSTIEGSKIASLFNWRLLRDMFKTCFEERPKYDRAIIWLVITSLTASIFVMYGAANVFYLFVREKFGWTIKDYNFYDAGVVVVQIFGNIIGVVVLQKLLKLSVITISVIAFFSCAVDAVIKAIATAPWFLYMALGVSALRGISSPMCRTLLAQIVPMSDIGKIYSFTTSLETLSPLMSAPLYTLVYDRTLKVYPGAFNIISAGFYGMCTIFLVIVFVFERRYPRNAYGPVTT